MGGKKGKSKKRSYGKERNRPLKSFTLFLDENVDFDDVAQALNSAGVRYQRHRDHFKSGVDDETLLASVGKHRWILLTTDQRQRSRQIEKIQILRHRIRQFVFTSGNLSKATMVAALRRGRPKMKQLCSSNPGPFSASISKSGDVVLRSLHGVLDNDRS
jgi:hypothetical protein